MSNCLKADSIIQFSIYIQQYINKLSFLLFKARKYFYLCKFLNTLVCRRSKGINVVECLQSATNEF